MNTLKESIIIFLAFLLLNCGNNQSTAPRDNETGWSKPEVLPEHLYSAVKCLQYSNWSAVPDSEVSFDLSQKYIRLRLDSCFYYFPTVDTSCYHRDGNPIIYHHGLFCTGYGIGYLSIKDDTLRIRWTAEFSFDHDIELFYVPCDTIPGPICSY